MSLYTSPLISWESYSHWERVDLIGVLLVAIGVLGEALLVIRSIWFPYNPTDFPALESVFRFKKKHLEIFFGILVALGVGLELRALPKSLNESHKQIASLNQSNLMLQLELNGVTTNVAQISTNVANIDPFKQPITSISFIIVLVRKTNGLDISGLKTLDKEIILTQLLNNPIGLVDPIFTNGGIAEVFLGVKGHVMQNGKSQLEIATEARQVNQFLIERDNTTEKFDVLYFNSNEKSFMNFLSFTNPTGLSLEDLDEVVIDMFNPYNPTEVVKGVAICNVNGYSGATKYFIFPPQIRNTNSWAVFALRAPDSFNWLNFVRSWY